MRKGAVIALIIILMCVAGGVIGLLIYNNSVNQESNINFSTGGSGDQTGAGIGFEEDQSDVTKESAPSVTIPGWEKMTIDAGTTEVYVDLYNPDSNEGNYYMTFELRLTDTDEVLYTSKMIKPGDHVKKITLTRPLEAGVYDAYVHVQPYNANTLAATNNADMKFKLYVV